MTYKRFVTQQLPFMCSLTWKEKRIFYLADRWLFAATVIYTTSTEIIRLLRQRHRKPIEQNDGS